MSSNQESSTRYKSRLLNFFNRQYLKINSSLGISVRQFTQTVNTGIATILYPFYVLFNKTKKLGNVFSGTSDNSATQSLNSTPAKLSSDYILEEVSEQIINIPEIPKLKRKSVKGLASLIDNKKIIIAKPKNQVKIVFPPRHQEDIKTIINSVVTEYKKNQELLLTPTLKDKKQLKPSFGIFNPFKFFSRKSKIIQDLEQLKDSDLVLTKTPQKPLEKESIEPDQNKIVLFIDKLFLKIEKGTLALFNKEKNIITPQQDKDELLNNIDTQETTYFLGLIEAAVNYFFGSKDSQSKSIDNVANTRQSINHTLKEKYNSITQSSTGKEINQAIQGIVNQSQELLPVIQAKTEKLMVKGLNQASVVKSKFDNVITQDDNPLNIQALILAAIDYFFNVKLDQNKPLTFSQNSHDLLLIDGQVSDPWLSWEDLYGEEKPPALHHNLTQKVDHQVIINSPVKENLSSHLEKKLEDQEDSIKPIPSEKKTITLVKETQFTDVEKHPSEGDIEAKVVTMGYEKHFLEIILEKLDLLILIIEEWILKIVTFCRSLIKKLS
ncbi:MAG: hypothetical protein ACXITR_12270 [Cyanobacterium sp.]